MSERPPSERREVAGDALWALLATLGGLALVTTFGLGADAWAFKPGSIEPHGLLGPLVRAADEEWSLGLIRSAGILAGVLVVVAAAIGFKARSWSRGAALALTLGVVGLLAVPPVLLQVGLRDATEPWFFTNDSTYQIELAGDLLLDGDNPYGHDYRNSGLERFYSLDGTVQPETRDEQVALRHLAYFPGTPLTAAAWRLLPDPLDDYRLFVLVATLALLPAFLLLPAPFAWTLPLGAVAAANPLAVHGAWFGTADAPSILFVVLAFALAGRRRAFSSAACLAVAILLKQFAVVAVPFVAATLVVLRVPRPALVRTAALGLGILLLGLIPFVAADSGAFWEDTIAYGEGTYRIVGYGLSALLLRAGILDDRTGSYPFTVFAILLWLPLTAWFVRNQLRARALWTGAAGFAASIFVLIFLARAFHKSYLIWPLEGLALAAALASANAHDDRRRRLT